MFEAIQPYVGARPFEARDQNLFFGRDAEAVELVSRIVSHSDVLLYAQSGAGKTSLINARLVPLLQKEGYEVLAGARVQGPAPAIELSSISNLYMFQALTRLAGSRFEPSHLAGMSLQSYLDQSPRIPDAEGGVRPRVLVIDQFEELFTFYPERWPERRRFFEQLRDALNADRALHVLLSMREDYVAETEPYAAILPQKLRTRFRLERLREKPAVDAVAEPLRLTDRAFQNGVAASLVTDLLEIRVKSPDGAIVKAPGEFVEPVHLQVACERIWKSLKPGEKVITYNMLGCSGHVDAGSRILPRRHRQRSELPPPALKKPRSASSSNAI